MILAESEHFKTAELSCSHCGINGCTQALVDMLEQFRSAIGKPVGVNSAFRCAQHNAALGGAPHSQHLLGNAADVHVQGMTPDEMEKVARTIPAIKGIGRAPHQNYIHIDVRDGEVLYCWCYDEAGKTCSYYPPS